MVGKLKPCKKYLLACIPLYVLIIVIAIIVVYNFILYDRLSNEDKAFKTNNIVYADVIEILNNRTDIFAPERNDWTISYKYTDGNYDYTGSFIVYGKENAEAYKTNKVAIYIDGKGHSVAAEDYRGNGATQKALVTAIICLVVFCALAGVAVGSFFKQSKKIKSSGSENQVE